MFFGSLLILLGGFIALPFWNFNRPPFNLGLLERLNPGMSKQMVRDILGSPNSESFENWSYSRPKSWPIVYIYFDDEGRFSESEYDY